MRVPRCRRPATRPARHPHGRGQLGHDGQPEPGSLPPAPHPVRDEVALEHLVSWSGGMPGPSSTTQAAGTPPTVPAPTVTRCAAKEAAFSTRLATTWPSRSASAETHTGTADAGPELEVEARARSARGRKPSTTWPDHLGAVDRLQVEREPVGVQPGQVEQVLHQSLEAAGLGADHGGGRRRVVGGPVDHRVGVAADRGERRAQFVGDGEEELALLLAGRGPGWPPWR